MIPAGVSSPQAPEVRQSATVPLTAGPDMLVPLITAVPPRRASDVTHTPGAEMVCVQSASGATSPIVVKFENVATVSSAPYVVEQVGRASLPGRPSKSAIAETERTSSNAAGAVPRASIVLLPIEATTVTPEATRSQMPACSASTTVPEVSLPQLPVSAPDQPNCCVYPRLAFTTLIPYSAACAFSQSIPHSALAVVLAVPAPVCTTRTA